MQKLSEIGLYILFFVVFHIFYAKMLSPVSQIILKKLRITNDFYSNGFKKVISVIV